MNQYKASLDEFVIDYQCDYINQDDYENLQYSFELNIVKKKIGQIEVTDRKIINSFIENIFIGDHKEIAIKFRYKDQYEDALKYLKNRNNMV